MSSVRMCDRCTTVFSELEDGWQTFTASTQKRDEQGRMVSVSQQMDTCPSCAVMPQKQYARELEAHKEGDELAARIAKLERETGIGKETVEPRIPQATTSFHPTNS